MTEHQELELHTLPLKYQDEPLYMQLYLHLREGILAGDIKAGERLPSKRRLADDLKISQNTVIRAYQHLVDEGYVKALERSGYYVEELSLLYRPVETTSLSPPAQGEKESSKILYDFAYGGVDPKALPLKELQRAYRKVIGESQLELSRMPHEQGHEKLRLELSHYLFRARGFKAEPEQIILGSGTDYLMNLLFEILPEDALYAIEDPGFPRIAEALKQRKRRYKCLSLDQSGVCLSDLEKSQATILAVTPSHQFPTALIYPVNRRTELLQWAEESGRYLIEDDYDSEFKYATRPIPPLKSMDQKDKVIYLGSFSKSFSPAMRVSYLVLPKSLIHAYQNKQVLFPCPVPVLTQLVMAELIASGEFSRHLNRMRLLYKKKREVLVQELSKAKDYCAIEGADAGLHLVLRLKRARADHFAEKAAQAGIICYPMSDYSIQAELGERLILGYAQIDLAELEAASQALIKLLREI
ncbi:MAG: PLP-dependent aminotransferase family protein [Eubacteriales bacterium]|nr:PLP-dependent aminotransferase family protein [Eubacteriales bacterium]